MGRPGSRGRHRVGGLRCSGTSAGAGRRDRKVDVQLAQTADELTVVDSSPEALELNRQRVARPDVQYLVADLFTWRPHRAYDVVFFSFWLSHVPRDRVEGFWTLVRSCLALAGGSSLSTTDATRR